jgi:hypothetical protein
MVAAFLIERWKMENVHDLVADAKQEIREVPLDQVIGQLTSTVGTWNLALTR